MNTKNERLEVVNEIDFDKQFFKLTIDSKRNSINNVDTSIDNHYEGDLNFVASIFITLFKEFPPLLIAAEAAIGFLEQEEE